MLERIVSDLLVDHSRIYIAYSGGVDSHVLLHLLASIYQNNKRIQLTAIHINHNVSPHAAFWVKHCRKICRQLDIPFITKKLVTKNKTRKYSPEENLRKLRYAIFAEILPQNACLVTAHHADDQAETLLLQLLRGAGPQGLAAMPHKAKFACGYLVRPLLDCTRTDIMQYATFTKLNWVNDDSNLDIKYARNFVRHRLLPVIKKRWDAVNKTLCRVARVCGETQNLLMELADIDLGKVSIAKKKNVLNIKMLQTFTVHRQKNVLRFWLKQLDLPMPSEAKMATILRTIIQARYDAMPVVMWQGVELRRFRNELYAMTPWSTYDDKKLKQQLKELRHKFVQQLQLHPRQLQVTLRYRGEKIKLVPRGGTHSLKKLMQEWNIPPWERARIPLVKCDGEIVAVVGYYNHPKFSADLPFVK